MTSRTPVNGVGYDPTLLADAPQITKADKQEGYNPDLLEAQPNHRAIPVPPGARNSSKPKYAGASDESNGVRHAVSPMGQPPVKKPRSRKMIFIIVGAVLLLLVAVGVGVGVGVSKSQSNNTNGVAATPGSQGGQSTTTGKPISSAVSTSISSESTKPVESTAAPTGGGAVGADPGDGDIVPNPQSTTTGK